MKKIIFPFLTLLALTSCSGGGKKTEGFEEDKPTTQTDSLMKDIDDGHMLGMSRIGKLHNFRNDVQRIIDSIGKLPAKAQQSIVPYVDQLKANIKELDYADFAMEKWMTEFEMDSAIDNIKQRVEYLKEEKLKVDKVKEAILSSMQKADSLLKAKF